MGNYIDPLNFRKVLIDTFLGNQILFASLFIIVISAVCGYYQMSNRVYALILVVTSILVAAYLGEAIAFVILVLLGFIVFKTIASVVTR